MSREAIVPAEVQRCEGDGATSSQREAESPLFFLTHHARRAQFSLLHDGHRIVIGNASAVCFDCNSTVRFSTSEGR